MQSSLQIPNDKDSEGDAVFRILPSTSRTIIDVGINLYQWIISMIPIDRGAMRRGGRFSMALREYFFRRSPFLKGLRNQVKD